LKGFAATTGNALGLHHGWIFVFALIAGALPGEFAGQVASIRPAHLLRALGLDPISASDEDRIDG